MAFLGNSGFGLAGFVAAFFVFNGIARALSGSARVWTAHLAFVSLAVLILALARRIAGLRATLSALAFTLLALSAASAFVFPAMIRAQAFETAAGRTFSRVGSEVSTDPDSRHRDPFLLSPALSRLRDPNLLTLPRLLTLATELPAPIPDPKPGKAPDGVFASFAWTSFARRFPSGFVRQLATRSFARMAGDRSRGPVPRHPNA